MNHLIPCVLCALAATIATQRMTEQKTAAKTLQTITEQCDDKASFYSNGVEYRCRAVGPMGGGL